MPILTHFSPDPSRLAIFKDCIDDYGVAEDENAEWPNNILSRQTVVYGNGTIARANDEITFAVDSDELDLCIRLANEAAALMIGVEVGLGSESSAEFSAFWICANVGDAATEIEEDLICARFGGTLFPPVIIKAESASEQSEMFTYVREEYEEWAESEPEKAESCQQTIQKWRAMFQWFNAQTDFRDTACVFIGSTEHLWNLSEDEYPPGTVMTPCVLPRLLLGLTQKGSLCGLFGFTVQT